MQRRILFAGLLLAASVVQGCVSATRHGAVAAERDQLARQNLELRRALAEQAVRAQEAIEALRRSQAVSSSQDTPSAAPPIPAPPATPLDADIPIGPIGAPAPAITDEEIRRAVVAPESGEGDDATLKVARRYAAAGKSPEAILAYTRLIEEFPFSPLLPEAFIERGRLRQRSGDRAGALEDFDTVAEAFPGSPQAPEARRLGDSLRRP